ncbi:MAG: SprT family zinc-dependent metalloprotease [Eubacteriales bacterium]|nr:SprT family zinc-dependent metalloprotease [Eubacteriales bacterium]
MAYETPTESKNPVDFEVQMDIKKNVVLREGIEIEISRKKMKNLRLTINPPEGKVKLSVPHKISSKIVDEFILSKMDWIKKKRSQYENRVVQKPREYITGEVHPFLGADYQLSVVETNEKQRVEIGNNRFITMFVKPGSTFDKRQKLMMEFQRTTLKTILPALIDKWETQIGVKVSEFNVKKMKTKWGTCNITNKRIWINLELARYPVDCLEYIVAHEMIHLLERYHNKRFYKLMDDFYPGWKDMKKKLKTFGVST